jgi:hypothetical protein
MPIVSITSPHSKSPVANSDQAVATELTLRRRAIGVFNVMPGRHVQRCGLTVLVQAPHRSGDRHWRAVCRRQRKRAAMQRKNDGRQRRIEDRAHVKVGSGAPKDCDGLLRDGGRCERAGDGNHSSNRNNTLHVSLPSLSQRASRAPAGRLTIEAKRSGRTFATGGRARRPRSGRAGCIGDARHARPWAGHPRMQRRCHSRESRNPEQRAIASWIPVRALRASGMSLCYSCPVALSFRPIGTGSCSTWALVIRPLPIEQRKSSKKKRYEVQSQFAYNSRLVKPSTFKAEAQRIEPRA